MDQTYRLLQEIKKRPGLYLGTSSLECLRAFLNGYRHQELESNGMCQPDCMEGFTEYIQERYGLCTDHDWAGVIRFFSSSDQHAWDTFYEKLDEFLGTKCKRRDGHA